MKCHRYRYKFPATAVLPKLKYLFILLVIFFYYEETKAQTSSYGELQAAYMFNFAKYIKWPDESKTFVIGIYGQSDILEDLQNILRAKKAGSKEIVVKEVASVDELLQCYIIYLPGSNSKNIVSLKQFIEGKSILIVTEEDLIKKGAAISFVVEDERLRFKLNKKRLAELRLKPSEGLLKLAIQL